MQTISYITGNQNKFTHISGQIHLPEGFEIVMQKLPGIEIQASSVREVAIHKAQSAYDQLQKPVLVTDAGMNVPALNGFPGPYLKDFVSTISQEMLYKIFQACDDKSVQYEDSLVYIDENNVVHEFHHSSKDILVLSDRIGTKYRASHPMDNLLCLRKEPGKTLSEQEDLANLYDGVLLENNITPCWVQFSQFLKQQNHSLRLNA